ncbi:MAG: hypothetical protein ONB13_02695 [candidate division KSB1 bacterium]|nr:hypothetical protein [candidate division KSB1 bacterium]MDZ7401734.1 hypothetical protein [candidate division KSB1 bacterium]
MLPIYKSSALTLIVLVLLFVLRSMDIETQRTAYQFFILLSIAMATLVLGYWAIQYLASILGSKRARKKREIILR